MRWIPGGTFAMGSDDFYPEERPVHRVSVDGFWMDATSPIVAPLQGDMQPTVPTTKTPKYKPAGPGAVRARARPRE